MDRDIRLFISGTLFPVRVSGFQIENAHSPKSYAVKRERRKWLRVPIAKPQTTPRARRHAGPSTRTREGRLFSRSFLRSANISMQNSAILRKATRTPNDQNTYRQRCCATQRKRMPNLFLELRISY